MTTTIFPPDLDAYAQAVHRHADNDEDANSALFGRTRDRKSTAIRRAAFVDLRRRGWSLPRIGRASGYDHTTVLHHLNVAALEAHDDRRP